MTEFSFSKVSIIGAGPGGSAAALHLSCMGIPCDLIDKSIFPRDKTCGDAVSGKAYTILNRIDPGIPERLNARKIHHDIYGMRLFAPNQTCIDLPFKWKYNKEKDIAPGAVISRKDLDNFLVDEVKNKDNISFYEGLEISRVKEIEGGYELIDSEGNHIIKTQLLLIANGANSKIARQLTGLKKLNKHYAGAVRGYYQNVKGFHPDGFIELHFLKEYVPGYFWIFPMENNLANVGLGLRTDLVSKRRINLRKVLQEIVSSYPGIAERFSEASPVGPIKGYPLPLGSLKMRRSGNRFMLLGDAAQLIDPLTGEGIGNAIYSGWIAAEQARSCFELAKFDEVEMENYDRRINRVLGVELKISNRLQHLINYRWLVNSFANQIDRHDRLKEFLTRMYSDVELRKKLVNPWFIIQVLSGKR